MNNGTVPAPIVHERLLVLLSRWRVNAATLLVLAAVVLAHPTRASVVEWATLVVLGLVLRVWARGHIERRSYLTETGPYAFVRHPLYIGSFILGLGCTAMGGSVALVLVFVLVFLVMYLPKALREEAFMRRMYGDEYAHYAACVRAVLPVRRARLTIPASVASQQRFSWRRVLRHREWKTWLGVAAVVALLFAETFWR